MKTTLNWRNIKYILLRNLFEERESDCTYCWDAGLVGGAGGGTDE